MPEPLVGAKGTGGGVGGRPGVAGSGDGLRVAGGGVPGVLEMEGLRGYWERWGSWGRIAEMTGHFCTHSTSVAPHVRKQLFVFGITFLQEWWYM